MNDSVCTANINTVTMLNVTSQNIFILTGIQDFTSLSELRCYNNNLVTLDVSANIALTYLYCYNNNLIALDVSANNALHYLACRNNNIATLNVNTNLRYLICNNNLLTTLDLSANPLLIELKSYSNNLISLDVRNGTNSIITDFNTTNNPNLTCINVDNVTYSDMYWTDIDPQQYFSINCNIGLEELEANIHIYPTPSKGQFVVDFQEQGLIELLVINALGEVVYTAQTNCAGVCKHQVDLTNAPKGVYILQIRSEYNVFNKKLILK